MSSTFCTISAVCTVIIAFKIIRTLFDLLYDSVIASALDLKKVDWNGLGKWALVTGSTDGIGKAYSEALAKKGFNMVLVSRTQSKLNALAGEIRDKFKVDVKTIAADFTKTDIYVGIEKQLDNLEIGVLINNVGMSLDYPDYFLDIPNHAEFTKNLLNCNVLSVMNMSKIVMPGMVKRRKGVVVNVASISALIPCPLISIYAATKAAVTKFTQDLSVEYRNKGLIIQAVCPGLVATKLSKIKKTSLIAPSPEEFVDSALITVGLSDVTTGYLIHTLQLAGLRAMDIFSKNLSGNFIHSYYEGIRKRALEKYAKTN